MNDINRERVSLYQLLARLFISPPDPVFLTQLATIELSNFSCQLAYQQAWNRLSQAAASIKNSQLDDEFHQLFIGLGKGELLPYLCYYETGFLMEKPLVSLRADLLRLGYRRQAQNTEPEDHISAICEVMALLILDNRTEQHFFFQQYINSWFNRFFIDLKDADQSLFYQAVADLGQLFLQWESHGLQNHYHGEEFAITAIE